MSYNVAVWEGPRPINNSAAGVEFDRLMDVAEAQDAPPTPRIVAFVKALLALWPDGASPWALEPMRDACGPIVFLGVRFDDAEGALPLIAGTAHRRGLVCFGPQVHRLL